MRPYAAALALVLATPPGLSAQGAYEDPAFDACVAETETAEARRACERDWWDALDKVLAYGRAKEYFDADGELDTLRMLSDSFDWKTLLGLPPSEPFLRCMSRVGFGPFDPRPVWACITRFDPDAAAADRI